MNRSFSTFSVILASSILTIICLVTVTYFSLRYIFNEEPVIREPDAIVDSIRWFNIFRPRLNPNHPDAEDVRFPLYGVNIWETSEGHVEYTISNMLLQGAPSVAAGNGSVYAIERRKYGNRERVVFVYHWKEYGMEVRHTPMYERKVNATWLPLQFVNFLSNVNAFDWAVVYEPPEDYDVYFNRLDPKPND